MSVPLFIWGFIQSFIVGIIIPLVKRAKNNYILSSIFIAIALNILFQYLLRYQDLKFDVPEFLVAPDILDLWLPTLVFVYINAIMGKPFTKKRLPYFLVPFLWSAALTGYVLLNENLTFRAYIGNTFHKIDLVVIFLWKLFLLIKGYRLFRFKDISVKQKQQSILLWPKMLFVFLGLLTYIAFTTMLHWGIVGTNEPNASNEGVLKLIEINYLLFTCSIIFITLFFAFKYPKILSGLPLIKNMEESDFPELEKHQRELSRLMDEQKMYLDTELDEKKLAHALGIHSYILSKLLNEHMGKSFSEFVNEKRIAEAKRLLRSSEHDNLTIFAIAVDSGFRSESVFYVNFKKFTGKTPTQYKKMNTTDTKEKVISA
ncbi:AraC family transcriptional regulator [Ulvibacterium sp.]|uniref:helix-turn-helix domain-containing protein n=1 Tax=Ulvibacterium sp. TaxID=2665914 RepID=UPI00263A325E|nr:AraC family transcriptional regulator [Ulvibacterium sp.]